eukprot:611318-Rhodomonas_salina.3
MERPVAAMAASGASGHATTQNLDAHTLSPFPFVFVAGIMDTPLEWRAYDVVVGWKEHGVEHGNAVAIGGNWYGKGGCGERILQLKPSTSHIDARIDSNSRGMCFKDGVVPYEQLNDILESVSEAGKRVQLLVLSVSDSADHGQLTRLSR